MTTEEIRATEFERVRKGYSVEDVDDFLQLVAGEMDSLAAERDKLGEELQQARADAEAARGEVEAARHELEDQVTGELATAMAAKDDAEAKMYVLAEKVEEYRGMEDNLKNALINAQRMGETVVHEAKQKAEQIVREATGQAELLTQKAEREIIRERNTLEHLVAELNAFKSTILNLYKQHIESLSALDPPNTRAAQVLAETERYKEKDSVLPPAESAPPLGSAAPVLPQPPIAASQMPVVNAAPIFEPLEYAIASDAMAYGAAPQPEATLPEV